VGATLRPQRRIARNHTGHLRTCDHRFSHDACGVTRSPQLISTLSRFRWRAPDYYHLLFPKNGLLLCRSLASFALLPDNARSKQAPGRLNRPPPFLAIDGAADNL
jgi:hypothetical protein